MTALNFKLTLATLVCRNPQRGRFIRLLIGIIEELRKSDKASMEFIKVLIKHLHFNKLQIFHYLI